MDVGHLSLCVVVFCPASSKTISFHARLTAWLLANSQREEMLVVEAKYQ
jgi:hypothetical protein